MVFSGAYAAGWDWMRLDLQYIRVSQAICRRGGYPNKIEDNAACAISDEGLRCASTAWRTVSSGTSPAVTSICDTALSHGKQEQAMLYTAGTQHDPDLCDRTGEFAATVERGAGGCPVSTCLQAQTSPAPWDFYVTLSIGRSSFS